MKKKVKNSFNAYQLNRVNARIKLIENYLLESHNINREFINITDLAIKLSHFITKNEKQACDKSTLLRNKIYKSYINDYFYSQNNTKNTVTGNTLKIKQLKEEISLLEQENNLLKNNNPLGKSLILIKQKNPLDTTNKILITIYLPEELDTKLSKKMKINNMDRKQNIAQVKTYQINLEKIDLNKNQENKFEKTKYKFSGTRKAGSYQLKKEQKIYINSEQNNQTITFNKKYHLHADIQGSLNIARKSCGFTIDNLIQNIVNNNKNFNSQKEKQKQKDSNYLNTIDSLSNNKTNKIIKIDKIKNIDQLVHECLNPQKIKVMDLINNNLNLVLYSNIKQSEIQSSNSGSGNDSFNHISALSSSSVAEEKCGFQPSLWLVDTYCK